MYIVIELLFTSFYFRSLQSHLKNNWIFISKQNSKKNKIVSEIKFIFSLRYVTSNKNKVQKGTLESTKIICIWRLHCSKITILYNIILRFNKILINEKRQHCAVNLTKPTRMFITLKKHLKFVSVSKHLA